MKLQAVEFTVLSRLLLSWPGFLLSREDGAQAGATFREKAAALKAAATSDR